MSSLQPPRSSSALNQNNSLNTSGNFARPFDFSSASNNQSPAGLTRTPPASVRIPIPNYDNKKEENNDRNEDNNEEIQQLRQYQQQHEMSIKETAQRDKRVLMNRIEELSRTIHELQRRSASQSDELESYHRAFGTLDDFTSRQVRVREEMVVLRDSVRMWQDREADARREVSRLDKVLESIKRGQKHTSGESRLKDIEERLALAHLQRNEISQEIDDIVEMERTKRERHSILLQRTTNLAANGNNRGDNAQMLAAELAAVAPGVDGSYLNWQMRGKLADLKRLLRQKDESIESLQKAADSLQSVAQSDRFPAIGAANRPCPGCNDFAWKSPFCPLTGKQHLAFDEALSEKRRLEKENIVRAPVFIPLNEDDVTDRVHKWLEDGLWSMLKEYSSSGEEQGNVLYREKATGRIVEDLRNIVEQKHQSEHEERVREYEKKLQQEKVRREAMEIEAAKDPVPAMAVQPSMKTEILNLMAALESKKDENLRLRALLESIAASGNVGMKTDKAVLAASAANKNNNGNDDGNLPGFEDSLPMGASATNHPGEDSSSPSPPAPPSPEHSSSNNNNDLQAANGSGTAGFDGAASSNSNNSMMKPSSSRTFAPFGRGQVYPNAKEKAISNASPSQRRRMEDGDDYSGGGDSYNNNTNPNDVTISLHDEDDVQTYTKMTRLQRENTSLSKRASELVLALVDRDDQINQLRESLNRASAMDSDRYVAQLRKESTQLRDRLLQEERRAANLEEEVRRLKRFEPRSFH